VKRYANLDIHGDLTLRGKFNDKLTTQGGFYSSFFGEIAYKTDIDALGPGGGGGSGGFYGINIKTHNTAPSLKGISVIGFSEDFYITQNAPNTDEVIVNLKNRSVRRGHADTEFRRTRGRGGATEVITMLNAPIPSNALTVGGVCRTQSFGKFRRATPSTTINFVVKLNNTTIYEDTSNSIVVTVPTQGAVRLELHLLQASNTSARLYGKLEFVQTPTPAGTNSPEIGIGSFVIQPMIEPRSINYSFSSDPTVSRNLTAEINWVNAPTAIESPFYHYMSYSEFL